MSIEANGIDRVPRVGFDVGNVILRNDTDSPELSFSQRPQYYLDGAVEVIDRTVHALKPENAFIISKCGPNMQERTLEFFDEHDFYGNTGFKRGHVLFCLNRADKAPIAADLGLTHFVDDRLDILQSLVTVDTRMLFRRQEKEPVNPKLLGSGDKAIRIAHNWDDVWDILVETIPDLKAA